MRLHNFPYCLGGQNKETLLISNNYDEKRVNKEKHKPTLQKFSLLNLIRNKKLLFSKFFFFFF